MFQNGDKSMSQNDPDIRVLRLENCPVCQENVPVAIRFSSLEPQITGLSTVVDVHGLDHSTPHVRILYVDTQLSVRSFSIVKAIGRKPMR